MRKNNAASLNPYNASNHTQHHQVQQQANPYFMATGNDYRYSGNTQMVGIQNITKMRKTEGPTINPYAASNTQHHQVQQQANPYFMTGSNDYRYAGNPSMVGIPNMPHNAMTGSHDRQQFNTSNYPSNSWFPPNMAACYGQGRWRQRHNMASNENQANGHQGAYFAAAVENYRFAAAAAASNQHMLGIANGSHVPAAAHHVQQYPGMNFPSNEWYPPNLIGAAANQQQAQNRQTALVMSLFRCQCPFPALSHGSSATGHCPTATPTQNFWSNCAVAPNGHTNNEASAYPTSPAVANRQTQATASFTNPKQSSSRCSSVASNHASNSGANFANHRSNSRCSSVASNQASNSGVGQQQAENFACSYNGYHSPSASIPPQSPYNANRSSVGPLNASHSTQQGVAASRDTSYPSSTNYSNSNVTQVSGGYPSKMGSTPPTPNPGYPTPPASVTQASQQQQMSSSVRDDHVSGHMSHFQTSQMTGATSSYSNCSYSSGSEMHGDSLGHPVNSLQSNSCMIAGTVRPAGGCMQAVLPNPLQATPQACLPGLNVSSKNVNPGAVSISQGQVEPNLSAGYTEQEIDFPSISAQIPDDQNFHCAQPETEPVIGHKKKRDKKTRKKDKSKMAVNAVSETSQEQPQQQFDHYQHYQNTSIHDFGTNYTVNQDVSHCTGYMEQPSAITPQVQHEAHSVISHAHVSHQMTDHHQQTHHQNHDHSHSVSVSCGNQDSSHHMGHSSVEQLVPVVHAEPSLQAHSELNHTTIDEKTLAGLEEDLHFLESAVARTQSSSLATVTATEHVAEQLDTDSTVVDIHASNHYATSQTASQSDSSENHTYQNDDTAKDELSTNDLDFLDCIPDMHSELESVRSEEKSLETEEPSKVVEKVKKKKKRKEDKDKSCSSKLEATVEINQPLEVTTHSIEDMPFDSLSANSSVLYTPDSNKTPESKSSISETSCKSTESKKKKSKKRKLDEATAKIVHDEYEFHDSPPEKKAKKSSEKKKVDKSSTAVIAKKTAEKVVKLTEDKSKNKPSDSCDTQTKVVKTDKSGTPKGNGLQEASNSIPKEKPKKGSAVKTAVSVAKVNNCLNTVPSVEEKKALNRLSNKKENLATKANKPQNISVQSMGTNTPRRRSSDKKALTIREGMMRTGDFVVSQDESKQEYPIIWRIEGKSLLQRFEPAQQDGVTIYNNSSSYSAWNPTVRQRYVGLDVRIISCSRTKIVVEKLGLTKGNASVVTNLESVPEPETDDKCKENLTNSQLQGDFEVFIQTLISQALDPHFIIEIVNENDDYFLSHVQAIDEHCQRKKNRFFTKVKWDSSVVKCVESFPLYNIASQNNAKDLRCKLCHDNWSSHIFNFYGDYYDLTTLENRTEKPEVKLTKYAACDNCKEKIILFSKLHHQKYNFYMTCKEKVEEIRRADESKESHVILEQCLQDYEWIQKLFEELETLWSTCDKMK
ncbi:Glutamine and serine-rich protein 1 [Halotydeus destructor]|nr:Glutamine and serine-rich protein 1 [Halotydeus destructor]